MDTKTLIITIIVGTLTNVTYAREEWIDPHDMNIGMKPARKDDDKYFDSPCLNPCNCVQNFNDKSSFHLRKVIRLITGMTYFDRKSEVYKGVIDIRLNTKDYDFLRNIMSDQLNDDRILRQLNEILDKSLEKSFYSTYFFSIGEYLFLTVFTETTLLILGLLASLIVLWKMQPHNYKIATLFKIFFPLVYISDFFLRYRAKLEEVEIDKFLQYESYKACDPSTLGWFDWFYDKFTGYCQKDKKKFMLSQRAAIHIFTPLHIISEQFDILVTVLKHLGTGFGSFMWGLIECMPWYIKPFAVLLSFILVIFMLLMLGSYSLGISPKFNLFHMLHFECSHQVQPTQNNTNQTREDCISGKNLSNLLKLKSQLKPVVGTSVQKKNSCATYKMKQKIVLRKRISKPLYVNDQKLSAISDEKANLSETDESSRNLNL